MFARVDQQDRCTLIDDSHRNLQVVAQVRQRIAFATHLDGGHRTRHTAIVVEPTDLLDDGHRDSQRLRANLDHHRARNLQADGELHREGRPLAHHRIHFHRAAQPRDSVVHHIQANTAPTLLGDAFGGGIAGTEDKVDGLFLGDRGIGVNQATRYGGGPHLFGVDARAIIADRDDHLAALIGRLDENTPLRLFAVGLALLWRLDAVVDSVAHQMQQRAFDFLEDLAINLGFDAFDEELDLFMRAQRRATNSAIEAWHQRLQWHQTRLEQPILEV